jgi:hypothetical protein
MVLFRARRHLVWQNKALLANKYGHLQNCKETVSGRCSIFADSGILFGKVFIL